MQSQISICSHPLPKLYSFKKSRMSVSAKVQSQDLMVDSGTMYDLLSVRETAGLEEIKAAYKRQARLWHPDVCPPHGDKNFFSQQFINARQAYEVLSDPVLRMEYDSVICTKGCGGTTGACSKFVDWESQLAGLKNRSSSHTDVNTWGSRMRRYREIV